MRHVHHQTIAKWVALLAVLVSGGLVYVTLWWSQSDVDPIVLQFWIAVLLVEMAALWGLPAWVMSDSPGSEPESSELRAKIFWQTQLMVCLAAFPLYLLLGVACSRMVPKGPFF